MLCNELLRIASSSNEYINDPAQMHWLASSLAARLLAHTIYMYVDKDSDQNVGHLPCWLRQCGR